MFVIGDRLRFHDGQTGAVARVINGGTLYLFQSDAGPLFTAKAEELAPLDAPPPHKPAPLAWGECRTIYFMSAPPARQRTPHQQQQARAGGAVTAAPKFTPGLRTAHDVRKLVVCRSCHQIGSRPFMIQVQSGCYEHGACYVERNGIAALLALPRAQTDGLALGDIGPDAMRALLNAWAARARVDAP